jgi:hypothetical protein
MLFDLADWEFFQAPVGPPPAPWVTIRQVWIDDEQGRIYGSTDALGEPVWLHPDRVPGRVLRRDPRPPTHPLEWRRIINAAAVPRADVDQTEALELRLAAIPEPEVRARPATLEEMPRGLRGLGRKAAAAGFVQHCTFARGPRLNQHWQVVEISDDIMLKGRHRDGRRFVVVYITKTPGPGTKNAGIPQWKPELGYAWIDGLWIACGPSGLEAYFTNGSLTLTQEAS